MSKWRFQQTGMLSDTILIFKILWLILKADCSFYIEWPVQHKLENLCGGRIARKLAICNFAIWTITKPLIN